jgi:hypothetical protein
MMSRLPYYTLVLFLPSFLLQVSVEAATGNTTCAGPDLDYYTVVRALNTVLFCQCILWFDRLLGRHHAGHSNGYGSNVIVAM